MVIKNIGWSGISESGKNLVFFGAGQIFREFTYFHDDWSTITDCLIDNNSQKQNTLYCSNKKQIPIISLVEFVNSYPADNYIIIVSVGLSILNEVLEQLANIPELNDIEVCIAKVIMDEESFEREKNRSYPSSFRITGKPLIPKTIHYCWFGGNELPEKNIKWIESWRKYCPDYEIIRWDETNYNYKKNRFMQQAYENMKWGFVSDYARLDVVHEYGGIYLDTDVEVIRSLDDLLYEEAFMCTEDGERLSTGLGFGSVKDNAFIKGIMELYDDIDFDPLHPIACPAFQLEYFLNKGFKQNGGYQIVDRCTIYPQLVLSPMSQVSGVIRTTAQTYSIHHFDASWYDDDQKASVEKARKLCRYVEEMDDNSIYSNI